MQTYQQRSHAVQLTSNLAISRGSQAVTGATHNQIHQHHHTVKKKSIVKSTKTSVKGSIDQHHHNHRQIGHSIITIQHIITHTSSHQLIHTNSHPIYITTSGHIRTSEIINTNHTTPHHHIINNTPCNRSHPISSQSKYSAPTSPSSPSTTLTPTSIAPTLPTLTPPSTSKSGQQHHIMANLTNTYIHSARVTERQCASTQHPWSSHHQVTSSTNINEAITSQPTIITFTFHQHHHQINKSQIRQRNSPRLLSRQVNYQGKFIDSKVHHYHTFSHHTSSSTQKITSTFNQHTNTHNNTSPTQQPSRSHYRNHSKLPTTTPHNHSPSTSLQHHITKSSLHLINHIAPFTNQPSTYSSI